ncbi:3-dehydroquinate synthase, partial [Vibrio sp. 10N.222.55.E8]
AYLSFLSGKQKVVVVSNVTVAPLYADKILSLLDQVGCQTSLLELPDGEQYKTLETFNSVMSYMLEG